MVVQRCEGHLNHQESDDMFHMRSSSIDMSVLNGVNIFSRDELLIRDHRDPVKKARAAGSHLLCTLMTRYQQQFKGIRPVDSGPIGKPDKVTRRTRNLQGKTDGTPCSNTLRRSRRGKSRR